MPGPLLVLEGDLHVHHNGHPLRLVGSGGQCVVHFPTLRSLCHYVVLAWRVRSLLPLVHGLHVQWRTVRVSVPRKK
jgi:hypothetical protein